MKKYGLQLRFPPDQQKKMTSKPPVRLPASIFGGDDDDDDLTKGISRQAPKSRALQMIDEQQKKTLEEDPMAFDYDGVYDEMKSSAACVRVQDQSKREPKYITSIIETVKKREREHEIIYERKLLKERSKDDHIYEDKEKFVTSAYKQKLGERTKWLEEERLRGLREEKEDVTKKSDLTDFYFSLNKNVAFGAQSAHASKPTKGQTISIAVEKTEGSPSNAETSIRPKKASGFSEDFAGPASSSDPVFKVPKDEIKVAATTSDVDRKQIPSDQNNIKELFNEDSEDTKADKATGSKIDSDRFKRSEDAVVAARERFMARKKAREQM
ncbi:nuclear speckle splicing regulatory protein 1-like [Phalaenopsis equestris]|uniref:nuclear speckle splicing regulatory protein 1-like n=1 Tax=Phalaenopsis equestris TaxID=78828 RepID=UPI0009E41060|nr:nuclear speckle splicing regulatory protein 1-like [Phalaenopsis equestris]